MPLKLNIGGGNTKLDGYTVVDRKFGKEAYPLDYPDNSADAIRASHVLEHFNFTDAMKALKDWVRVLKPGGVIQIAVPDFDKIVKAKKDGDELWRFYASGGQIDANDQHYSTWDEAWLGGYLHTAGLVDIRHFPGDPRDCSSHKVSLNMQGTKPLPEATERELTTQTFTAKLPRIAAIISCPRLGFTDFWGEAVAAFGAFNIPLRRYTGAFWDQGIQNALEDVLKEGFEYVFTCDYDSLFTVDDIQALIDGITGNTNIDALAAYQARRGDGEAMYKGNPPRDGREPFAVRAAHFGLTILRVEKFRAVKKPWFLHIPDQKNEYRGEDRYDADGTFWLHWNAAGNSVWVTPAVRVGHLETVVSTFDAALNHVYMKVDDWRDHRASDSCAQFAKEFK